MASQISCSRVTSPARSATGAWASSILASLAGTGTPAGPPRGAARSGWTPGPGDSWRFVEGAAEAGEEIAPGARVFLATGARSLGDFAALAARRYVVARVIDPPDRPFPFPRGQWLVGRPPFTEADEIATLRAHRIDVLVAKNAGGPADAKLAAARALGLPVVLLNRPPPPPGDRVESVAAALAWLERLA